MSFTDVLTIVGGFIVVFYLMKLLWTCCCGLRQYFFSELWRVDLRKYGQWAVVTGATSGIGKAYASELARRGLDVVLISRSDDKLQMVAKEIEDQYGRKTCTIQVDFTDGHSIYPTIASKLQGLDIGILAESLSHVCKVKMKLQPVNLTQSLETANLALSEVNNVGMTFSDNFAYFLEIPDAEQKITQVINCNILSVPQMTRLVLPDMVKRGTGLIINVSSEVGIRPYPLLSLYSATKIFVTYFSQCLHAEYKTKGITVQCVAPFMVSTNMTKNIKVTCFVKSASGYAREALNTVGYSSYTSGCLSHALQNMALTLLLPEKICMSSFFIGKLKTFATSNPREKEE